MEKEIIPVEIIKQKILLIRGMKIILDIDLAKMYGVGTKVLNQGVKRNQYRFPIDFMFQLTNEEKDEVVTKCDHLVNLKFSHQLPYAFTEHGIAMLSSILNSRQAIHMNIFIIRAFIKLREMALTEKDTELRLIQLENWQGIQTKNIEEIISILRNLTDTTIPPREPIGFRHPSD